MFKRAPGGHVTRRPCLHPEDGGSPRGGHGVTWQGDGRLLNNESVQVRNVSDSWERRRIGQLEEVGSISSSAADLQAPGDYQGILKWFVLLFRACKHQTSDLKLSHQRPKSLQSDMRR